MRRAPKVIITPGGTTDMNASSMIRDGRNSFCSGYTPEEYLKRVGRKLSGYSLHCFKQGWDDAAEDYEKDTEWYNLISKDYLI